MASWRGEKSSSVELHQGQLYRISDGKVIGKGIEFSHAPYKVYEGADCTNPQVHFGNFGIGAYCRCRLLYL